MIILKKLVTITGTVLIACLMVSTFFAPQSSAAAVPAAEVQSDNADSEVYEVYVIKALDNRVVVYRKGESVPFMRTDTLCSSLPKGDVVYLEKGIEVSGREGLRRALEDYCS